MFAIPTLADLTDRARKAFRANLPGSDAWLWPNNVNPTAKVLGGLMHELFGFADDIQRQKFAVTADGDNLDRHGAEIGLGRKEAKPATGVVTLTTTVGVSVAFGALFQRLDGVQFKATSPVNSLSGGTLDVPVTATTDGAATTTIAGAALQILSGVTDIAGTATAAVGTAGIVGGADVEIDGPRFTADLGTYRGRILFKKRNPPQGGSAADYVEWASSQPNVTRVFVERLWAGFGTVRVFILMDNLYANGIPQAGDIAQVASFISTLQPSGAIVSVVAPTPVAVNITVTGLTPSSPATQTAVRAELQSAFLRLSAVAGNDAANGAMPYLAIPGSFAQQWLQQAVNNATGVVRGRVTTPASDIALTAGQIATLGTLTFA